MFLTRRKVLCLLTLFLNFSLGAASFAQPKSLVGSATTEAKELATALVQTKSDADQEALLAQHQELLNAPLLAALKSLATPLIQKGDYGEAARISQLAVRVAEKMGDRAVLGSTLCDLGSVYGRQQNRAADALEYLQKSLALLEEAGDKKEQARALQAIGVAYGLQRRNQLAIETYTKSLALSEAVGDKNLTALTLNSLGLAHASMGNHELGLDYYQKARVLSEQINDKSILNMALNNIATIYIAQGRFAEALDNLQKSLKIMEELGSAADRRSLAYKLQNIGLIYRRQGRLDQALAYSRKSLDILVEIDDKFGTANLQNNIGVIYKSQGLYEQSLEWFQKARQGYEAIQATPGVARSLNNIGDVYRQQQRFVEAQDALQTSLRLREQNRDRGGIVLTLNNLGRLYLDQKKYSETLAVSTRAAQIAEEINDPEDLWNAQERLGRAQMALGQSADARQSFLRAIATLEALRQQVAGGEQQQQSFMEDKLSPWLGMIDLLVSETQYEAAFNVAEQSKARVLLDALQGGRTALRKSLSAEEREGEEQRRLKLVNLNSQFTTESRREKPDAARIAELKASVEKARLDYEAFETQLYAAHPELKVHRGEAPLIKAEELGALLPDEKTALLEYVVADDKAYLFVVAKEQTSAKPSVRLYTLPIGREPLAKQIERFRDQLAARDLGFRTSAAKLYELLLKSAEPQLVDKTSLIIVPDDTLWDLPFQALVTTGNKFLIEKAAIAYAPSATVLREMNRRHNTPPAPAAGLFALGNPNVGAETMQRVALKVRDGKLEPLPEAEEEVKALRALYGGARSRVYIGVEAREDRVKSEASGARILHFATHGMLDNTSPMYSHLALAKGGANEDGLLEAWELMQLDLHADLAVLSACETARGHIGPGEGIVGFSWAMFIAGVPSIVVSQWKVESASTRDLMVDFHRGLMPAAGLSKAEALRRASLKLMKNSSTSHPFYWAGFVLVGDGR